MSLVHHTIKWAEETPNERGKYPARTLESLQADHLRFESIGKGDIRQAKYYNNVIGSSFFSVALLTQVCTENKVMIIIF